MFRRCQQPVGLIQPVAYAIKFYSIRKVAVELSHLQLKQQSIGQLKCNNMNRYFFVVISTLILPSTYALSSIQIHH